MEYIYMEYINIYMEYIYIYPTDVIFNQMEYIYI